MEEDPFGMDAYMAEREEKIRKAQEQQVSTRAMSGAAWRSKRREEFRLKCRTPCPRRASLYGASPVSRAPRFQNKKVSMQRRQLNEDQDRWEQNRMLTSGAVRRVGPDDDIEDEEEDKVRPWWSTTPVLARVMKRAILTPFPIFPPPARFNC